jgi:UDP-glucose 4-epimerase
MKTLITGGAGFIGSHLTDTLVERGHAVTVYDDYSTGEQENLAKYKNKIVFVKGNILDRNKLAESLKGIDYCFHFAAAVGVEKILRDPIGSLKTNIHGSENVLELCCELGIPVILASTSEIYGKNSEGFLREESDRIVGSPLLSRWTYSDAKALDEAFAIALANQRGLQVKIIRFFNTVGPRQSAAYGMVIPRFFEAAKKGLPLQIHGDGSQKRIFCHISDAVAGVLALWESDYGFGEAFNLGGTEETSILNLAKRIIEMTRSNSEISYLPYEELKKRGFEDIQRRLPDTTKLRKLTSWEPKTNLADILVDYYRSISKK